MRLLFTALACLLSVSFYAQDLIESHLPIVVIEYENDVDEIPDEPRVLAVMGIIDRRDVIPVSVCREVVPGSFS
jgi:hypothetical protein